jgi:hypothetical protein
VEWLANSDQSRVLTFIRRAAGEEVLVTINLSSRPFTGSVEISKAGRFVDLTPDIDPPLPPDAPAPERAARRREVNLPSLTLNAWGYRIFRRQSFGVR